MLLYLAEAPIEAEWRESKHLGRPGDFDVGYPGGGPPPLFLVYSENGLTPPPQFSNSRPPSATFLANLSKKGPPLAPKCHF